MKVTICRGLPGSGKSTWATSVGPPSYVASADSYFARFDGVYVFDPALLKHAHADCRAVFERCTSSAAPHVIVDNTNVTNKEMEFYIELALSRGYEVEIREFKGNYKSIHGVPEATIKRMRARWEPVKPEWEKYLAKG